MVKIIGGKAFEPINSSDAENNSIFLDIIDNTLKIRDNDGIIKPINNGGNSIGFNVTKTFNDLNDSNSVLLFNLPAKGVLNDLHIKINEIFNIYSSKVWSSGGNLNITRGHLAGCGTQNAGLSFGGHNGNLTNVTEEYDGTSWSSGGNLNEEKSQNAGAGTQNAGLSFGGQSYSTAYSCVTQEYDGTSWSSGGSLSTGRNRLAGCGTQNAGLSFGGEKYSSSYTSVTEEYDGTSWSNGGNLNTARCTLAGCGTQNAGLSFGGSGSGNVTEEYDGTSWSSGGNLNITRGHLAGCGTQNAGLSFGGHNSNASNATEEYDGTSWSSGGNLNIARHVLAGCGTQNAGLSFGGTPTGPVYIYTNATEEYDENDNASIGIQSDKSKFKTNIKLSATTGLINEPCIMNKEMINVNNETEIKLYNKKGWSGLTQGSLTIYYQFSQY